MMANHGQKIEEQRHVLNKIFSTKKTLGARGVKLLCLSSMLVSVLMLGHGLSAPAYAQNVYNTGNDAAQNEVRLQQMETQIRELTGRVEKQIYEINSLKQKIEMMEMAAPAAAPEQAPAQNTGASQIAMPENDQAKPLDLGINPPAIGGMKTAVPGGGTTDATATYEQAYANLKIKNYEAARAGFNGFLADHADHVLAANARYWLGETYYVEGEFKRAAKIFAEGFKAFPNSSKSPDILLKLGMSLAGMEKTKDACVALSQVEVKFPTGYDNVVDLSKREMEKIGCGA